MWLKQIYIDTALEAVTRRGRSTSAYLLKAVVADTDEKAQEIGRQLHVD